MKLEIKSFADPGDFKKERVVLRVLSDLDIGRYLLLRSETTDDGLPTAGAKKSYWFPDGPVKAGDLVILYSKPGDTSTKKLSQDRTAHFFYWGQDKALWGSSNYTAVVIRASEFIHKTPENIADTSS